MANKLKDTIYMEYIDPAANSKKFYQMEDLGTGQFIAKWGRIGTAGQSMTYPMSQWNNKYDEKVKKGYQVVSKTPNKGLPTTAPSPAPPTAPKPVTPPKPVKKDAAQDAKIKLVYDIIKKSAKGADPFDLNRLNAIRRNFEKTGLLKQEDMLVLNDLYKKYK